MSIAKSLITQLLIAKWGSDDTLPCDVPYRRMASDAAESISGVLAMLEGALEAKLQGSWPTAEPDWYGLYCEWKQEKGLV